MSEQEALKRHLERCEIEYIAQHGGGFIGFFKDLKGEEIVDYLRYLGFRIRKERTQVDETLWVHTLDNISVDIESADGKCGFVCADSIPKRRRRGR